MAKAATKKKFDINELQNLKWEAPQSALAKWNPEIHAAKKDDTDAVTINIYESIGEDFFGGGFTLKTLSAILRNAAGKDVMVNINSPGGDFFVGVAAMNMLKEYEGFVNVKIVGLAASAASVIAMGGDKIEIAETGFIMIHNAWTIAVGNKNDMQYTADMLTKFDDSMSLVYLERADKTEKEIKKMMDSETWLSGKEAVEMGFADAIIDSSELQIEKTTESSYNTAVAKVDIALAKQGMPRSERRELLKELKGTQNAAPNITQNADENKEVNVALSNILSKLNEIGNKNVK